MFYFVFVFAWVNYLQVWWAGLAHWCWQKEEIGICSWENGSEGLPLDCHQCFKMAVSYFWNSSLFENYLIQPNPNDTATFFSTSGCHVSLFKTNKTKSKSRNKNQPPSPKTNQSNKWRNEQTFLSPCSLYNKENLGLKIKRLCFLEVRCSSFWVMSVFKKIMNNSQKFWFELISKNWTEDWSSSSG